MSLRAGLVAAVVLLVACGSTDADPGDGSAPTVAYDVPRSPSVPDARLDGAVDAALVRLVAAVDDGELDREALNTVAASGDARLAWFVADLLRFLSGGDGEDALVSAFGALTGVDPRRDPTFADGAWRSVTNHLIAWDLPAPPGYREVKAELFLLVEPRWEPFFADRDATVDWRVVSWGGVLIDDRPEGDTEACPLGCIPSLDDPELTDADDGRWYPDGRIVFGVVVGDEAVAFPKHIMEVHEMVNITVGGRRLGIPYCTLCGSAQAYLLDSVPTGLATPVLRTSGLLSRSNKVTYDLNTRSMIDTFTGRAVSGPLLDAGVVLEQITVVASPWGAWRQAHPDTRIVASDGGIGLNYPDDPLRGRDDDGPIFPVGPIDPRLPVQAEVVGVIASDGTPVAFPADQARAALADGLPVTVGALELLLDGGGLRARDRAGGDLPAHPAFWFAWSQFHPATLVWTPLSG
ncbi:MAG: DUF3179 domain-containing (seleno)protein [Acidimicrobiales bacterium]